MKNLLLLLLLFPLLAYGQEFPKKPVNYVTFFDPFYLKNSVLNQEEEELLNAKLRAFEDSTGIQLFVYITLFSPVSQEVYSRKIFDTWGIGQKGKENGALIAIFTSDPTFTLVGPGLEAVLPIDICMEILDEEMTPHFQNENFYKGIDAGIDKFIYYSKHQYEPPSLLQNIKKNSPAIIGVAAIMLPFIIGFLLKMKRRN
ncbi:MAG: TPM domain-containing protein [Chryseolinea sp.]